ncbi:inward rectifier potassium channel 2-like [Diabrotica undecimpunctata]|uniref:inward rectifier potassium channel 2-like n=1 Tax=Diabrotica undecimpunctata TaxID=50387 RepID=UPI003B634963
MYEELEYDSVRDQYTEVSFDEFSEDSDENQSQHAQVNPLLILKRQKKRKTRKTTLSNLARLIKKSGRLNTFLKQRTNKNIYYIRDLGNTLLGIRWRWILITLFLVNVGCFLVFGMLWWVIAIGSGDFNPNVTEPCIVNTNTLTGYFLLSAETITTIGYGYRYPSEQCNFGWFMLVSQVVLSVAIQGTLVSVVYVKITKPITTSSTSVFSKKAVICMRDGKLRFIFRINDFTKKIWCGTNISLYFMDKESIYPNTEFEIIQMEVEPHGLLIFPLEIEHVINETSPLWTFRPLDILESRFEIIAVAEGSSNITGQVSQNRTSYSNSDILWGHRFMPCVDYDDEEECYVVDYKKFKQIIPFNSPLCSAKMLGDIQHSTSLTTKSFEYK